MFNEKEDRYEVEMERRELVGCLMKVSVIFMIIQTVKIQQVEPERGN